jgi:hypothetical protein
VKYNLENMSRSQLEQAIDEWILNERDRKILKRRLLDGIIYESLSYEFDLSVRHIKTKDQLNETKKIGIQTNRL